MKRVKVRKRDNNERNFDTLVGGDVFYAKNFSGNKELFIKLRDATCTFNAIRLEDGDGCVFDDDEKVEFVSSNIIVE